MDTYEVTMQKKNIGLKMSILQKICQRKFLIYVDVAGMQKCLYLHSFSSFATAQLFQMTALNKLQEFARKAKRNINLHSLQRVFSKNESFQMCFWLTSLNGIYPLISPHRLHCPHCPLNKNRNTANHNMLAWGECNCLLW